MILFKEEIIKWLSVTIITIFQIQENALYKCSDWYFYEYITLGTKRKDTSEAVSDSSCLYTTRKTITKLLSSKITHGQSCIFFVLVPIKYIDIFIGGNFLSKIIRYNYRICIEKIFDEINT